MIGGHTPGSTGQMLETETSKPNGVGITLTRLGYYFKPYLLPLLLVGLLIIIDVWTQVTAPLLIGQAVDCYLAPTASQHLLNPVTAVSQTNCWYRSNSGEITSEQNLTGLARLVLLVVALYLTGSLINTVQFYIIGWCGQHVLKNMRVDVFNHLHRLSMNYYSKNEAGSIMSRVTNDIETIQQTLTFALVNVIGGVLLIAWILYNMLTISPVYALISISTVPLMALTTIWISNQARRAFRLTRVKIGKVNADLQESISGVREIQVFNREEVNIETFRSDNAANRDANIQAVAYTTALSPALEGLGYLALAVTSISGGLILLKGGDFFGATISLGLIITFLNYTQRFNHPIQQISMMWTNIQSAVAGAERIFNLLDTHPEVQDIAGAKIIPAIQGRVEFKKVCAAYTKHVPVLKDISFIAEPGQTIAIVGQTGAGKTTITNLIARFYDVTSGCILIDGIDISQVSRASLRKQIGMVLQDTFLFSDSVINNIRFSKPAASDEEVMAAARLTFADDFIQRLPDGYHTMLGEHGAGLSQGQRQLLSIARAALSDPRILILDEATSSVDTHTEKKIQRALSVLLKNRTSFVIAHRLSTIHHADVILVIDGGRMVEHGTHKELILRRGFYYELYMSQFIKAENLTGADAAGYHLDFKRRQPSE